MNKSKTIPQLFAIAFALVMSTPMAQANDDAYMPMAKSISSTSAGEHQRAVAQEDLSGVLANDALSAEQVLIDFKSYFDLNEDDVLHLASVTKSDEFTSYRFHHFVRDIELFDQFLQVDVWQTGHVRSIWGNAQPMMGLPFSRTLLSPAETIILVENDTGYLIAEVIEARRGYFMAEGIPQPAYRFLLRLGTGAFFPVTVSAVSGELLSQEQVVALNFR